MAMLISVRICILHVLFLSYLSCHGIGRGVVALGINYGQVGNNLPPPEKVLALLSSLQVTKARIYDTNPNVLSTFANSSVDLVVTVENNMLARLADPQEALRWVGTHITPYLPATRISGIAVGNEVLTDPDQSLACNLVPAMRSIHGALVQLGLDSYIHVSTPNSLAVLAESYPPSAGVFKAEVYGVMSQFLEFLSTTRSPFWINAYPYYAYKDDPANVSLDYVLFNPNPGTVDPYTNLKYDNMLYAQVDAVIFAIARMGYGGIEVRVSETGWPSKGDADELGATIENAEIYNKNLMSRQLGNQGTPLRSNQRLDVFVFALFNEDMKPGPTSERNYGLFQPDGTMAYNVGISGSSSAATSSITSLATKVITRTEEFWSLIYWMFVFLLSSNFN
ncbi:hypothetical protein SAY87_030437 [Trapa incisa]|uniref:glucan endo-1,3-beta-D-glucosidase n=1 Tax=Trapa incisa TaxID=236973 RepID=A0AAN7KNI0_9MYRT|nr:hypothetical protein SAY87_030437 [Trapa incisa]